MFQLPKQLSLSSLAAKEWIGQRRENIRPWALFINTAHLRAPSSLPRLSKRVVKNIEYFHSNYFFVFLGLIAYCLVSKLPNPRDNTADTVATLSMYCAYKLSGGRTKTTIAMTSQ
uniref:PRA1 family protein n=1 Tax=Timema douglasi TaxID=61478 RepID=A0A7R8Z901_TIMDO|nr:unnamed protein product [Timema douglasi]